MESPVKRAGWTGAASSSTTATRTVERKRKGRIVDVMGTLPTPPRSREKAHLPTPETVRRHSKRSKHDPTQSSTSSLPTPQTLPRNPRRSVRANDEPSSSPSPSGHTTFYLSAASSARHEGGVRRRPGLTFAQQMGLISQNGGLASASTGSGGRPGMGVGMGGVRANGHGKVDQITYGRQGDPIQLEDNPFLDFRPTDPSSPGAMTSHRPGVDFLGSPLDARIQKHRFQQASLLSPPPTQKTVRIRTSPRTVERQRKKEEMKRMMDAEANPFLSHPGEDIHPGRAGPIVDESRPTVTYVFRGVKKVFANPFLHPQQRFPPADLDPEDDEFEPHPCPAPKLLWASGPSQAPRDGSSSPEQSPPTSPVATPRFTRRDATGVEMDLSGGKHAFSDEEGFESESEEEEEELPARRGLLFAPGGMKRAMNGRGDERQGKKAKGRGL